MLFLVADENFNAAIVRGLLRIKPDLDIVRVQDVGLSSTEDAIILEWAANNERVLLTHDVSTITKYAYDRIRAENYMPGVIEVSRKVPLRMAIDEILYISEVCEHGELEGQIIYLPLTRR
jgi:predicted nuclease of predicted toxin-antitoxin system